MSETGNIPDFAEPIPTNNNKEAEKQSSKTKKSKKSSKYKDRDYTTSI